MAARADGESWGPPSCPADQSPRSSAAVATATAGGSMGDKSPKAKQRGDDQKKAGKKKDEVKAKQKQAGFTATEKAKK